MLCLVWAGRVSLVMVHRRISGVTGMPYDGCYDERCGPFFDGNWIAVAQDSGFMDRRFKYL